MASKTKQCKDCELHLELECFGRDRRNRDGRKGICKACENWRLLVWRDLNRDGKYAAHQLSSRARAAAYYAQNRDQVQAKARVKRATPEAKAKKAAMDRAYREANKERLKARQTAYRQATQSALNAYNRMASKRPHRMAAQAALVAWRRAMKKQATPPWVDRAALVAIYREARRLTQETGRKHHVDHIVPLVSAIVCGLHVPWNLQPLFYKDNHRKSNKRWPDMPE